MSAWAKVASDLDANPKVRKAGRAGREVFLFVLRRNAALDLGGRLPVMHVESWYLADQLMMTEQEASHGLSRAVTAGLLRLDDGFVSIVGWDDEWSKRPLTEAERQAKRRAKLKASADLNDGVTESHDANVTCPDSHGSEESRSEEKREEEKREEEKRESDGASPSARAPSPQLEILKGKVDAATGDVGRVRARKAKPSDPTADERSAALFVLRKLGERSGVKHSGAEKHVRLIVARLREGITEADLRKVIGYCAIELEWQDDARMGHYLRPDTLFGPDTIHRYLDPARTWFEKQGLELDERPHLEAVP